MHTQNRPISKKFLLPLHLFEPGNEKMGVFLKRKLKILSLVWNGKRFLGGVFRKKWKYFFFHFYKQWVVFCYAKLKEFLIWKNLLSVWWNKRRMWLVNYPVVNLCVEVTSRPFDIRIWQTVFIGQSSTKQMHIN